MIEFKSKNVMIKGDNTIFIVENDKDRKRNEKKGGFEDLYPNVNIDGKIYETKDIECINISFVNKNNPIGIVV